MLFGFSKIEVPFWAPIYLKTYKTHCRFVQFGGK